MPLEIEHNRFDFSHQWCGYIMRYSIELRDLIVKVNVFLFFAKKMGGKYRLKPLD